MYFPGGERVQMAFWVLNYASAEGLCSPTSHSPCSLYIYICLGCSEPMEHRHRETLTLPLNRSKSSQANAWTANYSLLCLLRFIFLMFAPSQHKVALFGFQVVVVLQQVFALIQTVLSKWLNDSQVVEVSLCRHDWARSLMQMECDDDTLRSHVPLQAVCAIFEKSVKTLLHDFAPMVSQLSEMLGQMYSTIPQASALDLTRQVHTLTQTENCVFVVVFGIVFLK